MKVGDKVFIPKLKISGVIVKIYKNDNPYTTDDHYLIQEGKDPACYTMLKKHLVPDNQKIIQLSLF